MSDRPDIATEIPRVTPEVSTQRAACLSVAHMASRLNASHAEVWDVLQALGLEVTARELRGVPAPTTPQRDPGLCTKQRHPMTPENTRLRSDGGRQCRQCRSDAEKRRREERVA